MGKKNKQLENSTPEFNKLKINEKIINKKAKKEKSKRKENLRESRDKNKLKGVIKDVLPKLEEPAKESSISNVLKKHKKKKDKVKLEKDAIKPEDEDVLLKPEEPTKESSMSNVLKKHKKKKDKLKLENDVIKPEDVLPKHEEPTEESSINDVLKKHKKTKDKVKLEESMIKPEETTGESSISELLSKKNKGKLDRDVKKESKVEQITEGLNPDLENDALNNSFSDEKEEKKARHDSKPENTIFVGNLPTNTKKKQLDSLFKEFGKIVSIRFRTAEGKPIFKHASRLKAEALNAYVVFENPTAKEKALSLSGTEFKGRHIRVTAAQDFANRIPPKAIVFVGNLKYSANDEKLHEIFSTCGSIEYVRTIRNEKGCTGIAYVCFKKPESVSLALELNNTLLDDRPMRVQRYKKNPEPVKTNQKELKGPARRLLEKKNKLLGKKKDFKNEHNKNKMFAKTKGFKREGINGNEFPKAKPKMPKKEKKSDYQGKKIANMKKSKDKKKKQPTHLQKLAKKIAPK